MFRHPRLKFWHRFCLIHNRDLGDSVAPCAVDTLQPNLRQSQLKFGNQFYVFTVELLEPTPFTLAIREPTLRDSGFAFGSLCCGICCWNFGTRFALCVVERWGRILFLLRLGFGNQFWLFQGSKLGIAFAHFLVEILEAKFAQVTVNIWEFRVYHSRLQFGNHFCDFHGSNPGTTFAPFTVEMLEANCSLFMGEFWGPVFPYSRLKFENWFCAIRGWRLGSDSVPLALERWEPTLLFSRLQFGNPVCAIHGSSLGFVGAICGWMSGTNLAILGWHLGFTFARFRVDMLEPGLHNSLLRFGANFVSFAAELWGPRLRHSLFILICGIAYFSWGQLQKRGFATYHVLSTLHIPHLLENQCSTNSLLIFISTIGFRDCNIIASSRD